MQNESSLLEHAVRAWPDAAAIVSAQGARTYREYDTRAQTVCEYLKSQGPGFGQILGVLLPTSEAWLPLLAGCFRAGVTVFPVNTRLPREAAAAVMAEAGCMAVVVPVAPEAALTPPLSQGEREQERRGFLLPLPLGEGWGEGIDRQDQSQQPLPQTGTSLCHPQTCLGVLSAVPLSALTPPNQFGGATNHAGVDILLMTSGSTGSPKLAALSYASLRANAEASNRNIPLIPGDVWLLSLPLYHVSGLGIVFRCLAAGATVAVPQPDEELLDSIARYGVTHVSLVTTQLHRLMQRPEGVRALSGLKAILLGGSAMPPRLIRQALGLGLPLFTSYGLTETASQVATTTPADRSEEALRRARPLYPDAVRISCDGEIEVSGPTLFSGYWNGHALERPATPDGWFPTGDLGTLDEEGRLTVLGRKDNLFISGGENIQPEEIERELCAIEGVEQAVVVPVDDEEFGQRPVAFVKPAPDPAALRATLEQRLPRYKIPIAFHAWPAELDKPGKPSRPEFMAEAVRRIAR